MLFLGLVILLAAALHRIVAPSPTLMASPAFVASQGVRLVLVLAVAGACAAVVGRVLEPT